MEALKNPRTVQVLIFIAATLTVLFYEDELRALSPKFLAWSASFVVQQYAFRQALLYSSFNSLTYDYQYSRMTENLWPVLTLIRNYFLFLVLWKVIGVEISILLGGSGNLFIIDLSFVTDLAYHQVIWFDFLVSTIIYHPFQQYYIFNYALWCFSALDRLRLLRLISVNPGISGFWSIFQKQDIRSVIIAYKIPLIKSGLTS